MKHITSCHYKINFRTFILTAILTIQLALLLIFNITRTQYITDFDSSAAMAQAMEIVNQKTLFIKNWSYQSTLGLDSVLPIAALLYSLTHNIFISYGLADFIGTIFFLYIISSTLKLLNMDITCRYLVCIFLLFPFSQGMLGYAPMMFTGAAYYIIKAVYPVMLISLIIRVKENEFKKIHFLLVMLLFWFSFITGFSCQSYLLMCAILPILSWQILINIVKLISLYINNKKANVPACFKEYLSILFSKDIFLTLSSFILAVTGMYTGKMYYNYSFTNGMVLCNASNFFDNLKRMLIGHFELFGSIAYDNVKVISYEGITILLHLLIMILFVILTIKGLKIFIHNFSCLCLSDKTHNNLYNYEYYGFFIMIALINYIILVLTYTTYGSQTYEFRYLIIPFLCEVFICALAVNQLLICDNMSVKLTNKCKSITVILFSCIMLAVSLIEWNNYIKIDNNSDQLKHKANDLINHGYNLVLYIDNDGSKQTDARIIRLFSSKLNVVYTNNNHEFCGWGTSTKYFDYNIIKEYKHYIIN